MKEVMYLVGEFHPDTLARWTAWAKHTDRTIQHTTFVEIETLSGSNPLIILDDHGLNDAQLPE